jgi:hypothetical protein
MFNFHQAVQDSFIINGQGVGEVANRLGECRYDPGMMRPFLETDPSHPMRGRPCVVVNTGRDFYCNKERKRKPLYQQVLVKNLQDRGINSPVFNATSLRKEEWIMLDTVVLRAARYRLRAWSDLSAVNTFGGFNGMSKMILEHETMSDPGEAIVDMDGLTQGRHDQPLFQLQGLPLPITHSDFWFSSRVLAISRNSGTPLDTTMGEAAGRRVAESIEKVLIGNNTGMVYGGNSTQVGGYGRTSQVFGYLNFPARLTSTALYRPTGLGRSGTGWVPADTLKDVLALRNTLYLNKFFGPFMVYHSNDWDQYLDNDYILAGGNVATQTLRERLRSIEGISDVRRLDFLFATPPSTNTGASNYTGPGGEGITAGNPFTFVVIQMTPDVARAVNGMDMTTVQWEGKGGMQLFFKVMAIQVPQLRADFYGNCGLLQATATL